MLNAKEMRYYRQKGLNRREDGGPRVNYQNCRVCGLYVDARNRKRHTKACARRKREQPERWRQWVADMKAYDPFEADRERREEEAREVKCPSCGRPRHSAKAFCFHSFHTREEI